MLGIAESKKSFEQKHITKKSVRLRNHSTLSSMLRDKSKSLRCATILKVGFMVSYLYRAFHHSTDH